MNGLGHRVALLRHLIVFSLRGLYLGFIRTHVFHCIGVGIDAALPGSIGAMNRYGAQTQHHAPPVSDMPHETAETQRNQQKRAARRAAPDGG